MTTEHNRYCSSTEAGLPGSACANPAKFPILSQGIALAGFITIAALATWNLIRMLSLTPEVNGLRGNGPMPHQILDGFLRLWAILGFACLLASFTFCALGQWKNAMAAFIALAACAIAFAINGKYWYECIMQI